MAKNQVCIDLAGVREVILQELADCGVNPFAAKLISESFTKHPRPTPVTFRFGNAIFHMRPVDTKG